MPFLDASRTTDDVVAPTLADPLARKASGAVSGPLGRHARTGLSWWTPVRIILAMAAVMFSLGVVQKSPCVVTSWGADASPKPFSHMCYSDLPYLYVSRGLAEGIFPYTPLGDVPVPHRPQTEADLHDLWVEYPVGTGVWMGVTGWLTRQLGDNPDVSLLPNDEVGEVTGVQHDSALFWCVNVVGFFIIFMLSLLALVKAQRRRPWDAMFVAASPMVALAGFINWDMLAVGCVAGALWAWSTRKPILAGVFIGLGASTKLFPLFFLGPLFVLCLRSRRLDVWTRTCAAALTVWLLINVPVYLWSPTEWLWFWRFNASRGPDYGSIWLIFSMEGSTASAHVINVTTWIVFGGACALIAILALGAPRRPRLPQLLFLVVASFLLVNKVYSPQYVLWLLPLAALARPRWRDLIIWQACEVFYFFAVWMHIAGFFVSPGVCSLRTTFLASDGCDWVYMLSIVIRVAGELYLMAVVLRDIWYPWHDPVRRDGLSDDPMGGVLDEGIDAELFDPQIRRGPIADPDDLGREPVFASSVQVDSVEHGGGEPDPGGDTVSW